MMTIHLPEDLANSVRTEVLSGHFASEDEVVAAAVRDYLERKHGHAFQIENLSGAKEVTSAENDLNDQELQRRLYEAGVLSEIKPPIIDFAPYSHRQAVPIQGEPLSETVIRERR
jgi:Arc/MetJ-type ribon-helix-helix transcriptional regulator